MLTLQTIAMPADLNCYGVIFGGWIMGQIDLAGAVAARKIAPRILTVAAEQIAFKAPIYAGELISAQAQVMHIGCSSIKVNVELFTQRQSGELIKAASGVMVYVSVDENGVKRPIASNHLGNAQT